MATIDYSKEISSVSDPTTLFTNPYTKHYKTHSFAKDNRPLYSNSLTINNTRNNIQRAEYDVQRDIILPGAPRGFIPSRIEILRGHIGDTTYRIPNFIPPYATNISIIRYN